MLLTQSAPAQVDRGDNGNPAGNLSDLNGFSTLTRLRGYCQLQDQEQGNDNGSDLQYSPIDNHFETGSASSSPEYQYIGIINPNYPGFQHLAHTLEYSLPQCSDSESEDSNSSPSSNSCQTSNSCYEQLPDYMLLDSNSEPAAEIDVRTDANDNTTTDCANNNLDLNRDRPAGALDRNLDSSKDDMRPSSECDVSVSVVGDLSAEIEHVIDEKLMELTLTKPNQTRIHKVIDRMDRPLHNKMADAFLSCAHDPLTLHADKYCLSSEKEAMSSRLPEGNKQDKTQINSQVKRSRQLQQQRNAAKQQQQKQQQEQESLDGFDVYNIETAMPVIDLDAIEAHLKAAKEEEMRRRTDREEIRRRLAMGPEPDNYPSSRASRKQSLQSRLQSGMNLQICFMNDNISDSESPTLELISQDNLNVNVRPETSSIPLDNQVRNIDSLLQNRTEIEETNKQDNERPGTLSIGPPPAPKTEQDFFACQARLQVEARLALAQAKQMAHMQMELERQKQVSSPITDVIRTALVTVGATSPERHRRLSRRLLTSMTVAQLQVVVCRLHSQVELFNEQLVGLLMNRDELHMSQDSMLVDIEDLTRYL